MRGPAGKFGRAEPTSQLSQQGPGKDCGEWVGASEAPL